MQAPVKRDQLSEDRIKGSYGIGVGMLLGILRMWLWIGHVSPVLTMPLFVFATVVFTIGCCFYTKSKGFPPLLGLLGLLWIPGLVVLILLPDRKDSTLKDLQAEFIAQRNRKRQQQ